jgi:hypothetical protein
MLAQLLVGRELVSPLALAAYRLEYRAGGPKAVDSGRRPREAYPVNRLRRDAAWKRTGSPQRHGGHRDEGELSAFRGVRLGDSILARIGGNRRNLRMKASF